jgi:hypothetical protein
MLTRKSFGIPRSCRNPELRGFRSIPIEINAHIAMLLCGDIEPDLEAHTTILMTDTLHRCGNSDVIDGIDEPASVAVVFDNLPARKKME